VYERLEEDGAPWEDSLWTVEEEDEKSEGVGDGGREELRRMRTVPRQTRIPVSITMASPTTTIRVGMA